MQRRHGAPLRARVYAILCLIVLAVVAVVAFTARPTKASVLVGAASHYGGKFHGRKTACGQRYDVGALTAAHKTLPCGTHVTVHRGHRVVRVRITDRGPYTRGRIIDLTPRAFRALAPLSAGVVKVRLSIAERK